MKSITPLRILIAFITIFILGRTVDLFDNPVDPQFGLFQLILALLAVVLFGMYIYLVIKGRRNNN